MNINTRKFKALTVSFVILLLILGAAFAFIGKYFIQFDAGDVAIENSGQEIIRAEKSIDTFMQDGVKIIQTVSGQKYVKTFLSLNGKEPDNHLIQDVTEVFKVVIETNPRISQITHVDKNGNEDVKVFRNTQTPQGLVVSRNYTKIADKKLEEYYAKSRTIKEPFYSSFESTSISGDPTFSNRPTLDAIMPLYHYDEFGNSSYRGILVFQFDVSNLFKPFNDSKLYKYILFDRDGNTLYHHNSDFAWGRYSENKHNIKRDFNNVDSIIKANGLVLHKTFTSKMLDLTHPIDGGLGMTVELSSSYNKQLSERDFNYIVVYLLTFLLVFVIPGIIVHKYWGLVYTLDETKEYNAWLQQKQEQLQEEVYKDALTGIFNIKKFDAVFTNLSMDFINFDKPFSMIIFDIDNFRRINDNYSYQIADNIIRATVDSISFISRDSYTFIRYGGVKFVMLLPNTRLRNAVVFADKIRTQVAKMDNMVGEDHINVTLSVGVDSFEKGDTKGVFFERVQNYTEKAIDDGGNLVVFNEAKQNILSGE